MWVQSSFFMLFHNCLKIIGLLCVFIVKLHPKLIWTRKIVTHDIFHTHTFLMFIKCLFEFYSILGHLLVDTEHIIGIKCIKLSILCPRNSLEVKTIYFLLIKSFSAVLFVYAILKRFIKVFNLFFSYIKDTVHSLYLLHNNYLFHTRKLWDHNKKQ